MKQTFLKETDSQGNIEVDDQEESPENEKEFGSELSFNDDFNMSEGNEDQSANLLVTDNKNIGGGKLLSWGTGYRKGMKLGYQTPEEKEREKQAMVSKKYRIGQDDRLTVATSNAPDQ